MNNITLYINNTTIGISYKIDEKNKNIKISKDYAKAIELGLPQDNIKDDLIEKQLVKEKIIDKSYKIEWVKLTDLLKEK